MNRKHPDRGCGSTITSRTTLLGIVLILLLTSTAGCTFFASLLGLGSPDYRIAVADFPPGGYPGSEYSGSFVVTNVGEADGEQAVIWSVYLSADQSFEPDDAEIGSGVLSALAVGQLSADISYSGVWPAEAGRCYLIIVIEAADDDNRTNDLKSSSELHVQAEPVVDYTPINFLVPSTGVTSGAYDGSFTISNAGLLDGSEEISWRVFRSADVAESDDDIEQGAGSIPAVDAGGESSLLTFSGTWPATEGTCYLITVVSSPDDDNTTNNILVSSPIEVSDPPYVDYDIVSESFPTETSVYIGDTITGSFSIDNIGTGASLDAIDWTLYLSESSETTGAAVVASGQISAIAPEDPPERIDFGGVWEVQSGSCYLIAEIVSAGDSIPENNVTVSSQYTVSPLPVVDYRIIDWSIPAEAYLNGQIEGSFYVENLGTVTGLSDIRWDVYVTEAAALDGTEDPLSTSTTAGLAGQTSSSIIEFSGPSPATAGDYSVYVEISAFDEDSGYQANNVASCGVVSVIEIVDYSISSQTFPETGSTGNDLPASGLNFNVNNIGTVDRLTPITWSAYASLDTTLSETEDHLLSTGEIAAVAAGDFSAPQTYSGTWPEIEGTYYIVLSIESPDDPVAENNTAVSPAIFVISAGRLIGVGGEGIIIVSDDGGQTWTQRASGVSTGYLRRIASNGAGTWVAVGSSSTIVYSTDDGETWSIAAPPEGAILRELYGITFHAGRWVVVGEYNSVYYSDNAVDWSMGTVSGMHGNGVVYDPTTSRYVAVTLNNSAFYSEDDGVTWSAGVATNASSDGNVATDRNGAIVCVGYAAGSAYSTDGGSTWFAATTMPPWGGGATGIYYPDVASDSASPTATFVAAGNSIAGGTGTIAWSNDGGVNWNGTSTAIDANTSGVTYDPVSGRFVAMSAFGNAAFYSTNKGFTWTRVDLSFNRQITDIQAR